METTIMGPYWGYIRVIGFRYWCIEITEKEHGNYYDGFSGLGYGIRINPKS